MRDRRQAALGFAVAVTGLVAAQLVVQPLLLEESIPRGLSLLAAVGAGVAALAIGFALAAGRRGIALAVTALLALVLVVLSRAPAWSPREVPEPEAVAASEVLRRALALERQGAAAPGRRRTGEIVHALHEPVFERTFEVPPAGVLDTAVALDPMIRELAAEGSVAFDVAVEGPDGSWSRLERIDLDLQDPDSYEWRPIERDLSDFSGRRLAIRFVKRAEVRGGRPVFDLAPEDLALWRTPRVRPRRTERPNVVLISLDTVRADHLHFLGYRRQTTPRLDALAARSAVFTTAVSQSPWTTPSHMSLLTSAYPGEHGADQPIQVLRRRWNPAVPTLPMLLGPHGYVTAAFTAGGWMRATSGFYRGFDLYDETPSAGATISDVAAVRDKALEWLDGHSDRTFFLFVHTYEPHLPYLDDHFVREEGVPKTDPVAYRTALYDGDLRRADGLVGAIEDRLEALGLSGSTLLIVTSDHGEDLGGRFPEGSPRFHDHGHTLFDELLLVPLVIHAPGRIAPVEVSAQVRLIDVAPTVLDYLGLPAPATFRGRSLRPLIEGRPDPPRPAYSEATTYGSERESLRANGYKYIHRRGYGSLVFDPLDGLVEPLHRLFDLAADPGERSDLAARRRPLLERMQTEMREIAPRAEAAAGGGPPDEEVRDLTRSPEVVEELRALGYLR